MRYYFKYEVQYEDYYGNIKTLVMNADNPAHLTKRFKEKYPARKIIKFEPL